MTLTFIDNVSAAPDFITSLRSSTTTGGFTASGFIISEDLVLTSAHNVFSSGQPGTPGIIDTSSVLLTPQRTNSFSGPFGQDMTDIFRAIIAADGLGFAAPFNDLVKRSDNA